MKGQGVAHRGQGSPMGVRVAGASQKALGVAHKVLGDGPRTILGGTGMVQGDPWGVRGAPWGPGVPHGGQGVTHGGHGGPFFSGEMINQMTNLLRIKEWVSLMKKGHLTRKTKK